MHDEVQEGGRVHGRLQGLHRSDRLVRKREKMHSGVRAERRMSDEVLRGGRDDEMPDDRYSYCLQEKQKSMSGVPGG